jgi:hypothetical protein
MNTRQGVSGVADRALRRAGFSPELIKGETAPGSLPIRKAGRPWRFRRSQRRNFLPLQLAIEDLPFG